MPKVQIWLHNFVKLQATIKADFSDHKSCPLPAEKQNPPHQEISMLKVNIMLSKMANIAISFIN